MHHPSSTPALSMYHGAERNSAQQKDFGESPSPNLSRGAASLLRWLARWHEKTQAALFPHTAYIAKKQGRTERTVYRWLAELRAAGAIQTETTVGIERRIVPLIPSDQCPKADRKAVRGGYVQPSKRPSECDIPDRETSPLTVTGSQRSGMALERLTPEELPSERSESAPIPSPQGMSMSGVTTGVVSGVAPYTGDAYTQENNNRHEPQAATCLTGSPVAELVALGVTPDVAAALIRSKGEAACLEQVAALPYRKASDPAGVLVASIRGGWAIPQQAKKQAVKAQKRAVESQKTQERQKHRTALLERLSGLPETAFRALEQQARNLWQREQPAAYRVMGKTFAGESVVRSYMLRILEA